MHQSYVIVGEFFLNRGYIDTYSCQGSIVWVKDSDKYRNMFK